MYDIQKLPAASERVETGPVQFGDDWPGLFIRGDDALAFAQAMQYIAAPRPLEKLLLAELRDLLSSTIVNINE